MREPRGIVIVSAGGLQFGGGIGSVTRLIHANLPLHASGIRIDVLDPRGERRGGALWSLAFVPLALLHLFWIRVVYRSDILHLQVSERISFVRKGIFLVAGRLLGMRTVVHHHGAELIETYRAASPRARWLIRGVVTRADVNIVLGERWREFLISELSVEPSRVTVFYNTANDLAVGLTPSSPDRWRFLITANLSPRKGVSDLLAAVKALADAGEPVSLTLAGGGQIDRYRAEAEAMGLTSRCRFTGWIEGEALRELFFTHSALVLPSYFEGLPISILEALSAKLPVITTSVGSIPEVLSEGDSCLFVPVGDAAAIAAAMRSVATQDNVRESLRSGGRARYDDDFSMQHYVVRLVELYRSLVGNRAAIDVDRSRGSKVISK